MQTKEGYNMVCVGIVIVINAVYRIHIMVYLKQNEIQAFSLSWYHNKKRANRNTKGAIIMHGFYAKKTDLSFLPLVYVLLLSTNNSYGGLGNLICVVGMIPSWRFSFRHASWSMPPVTIWPSPLVVSPVISFVFWFGKTDISQDRERILSAERTNPYQSPFLIPRET